MGKEISTLGGAIATAGTAVAAGVTFGQVKSLNNAVESCATYTGKSFMETSVRHVGEATGKGIATAATAVAAGVTFGQVETLNNAVVSCAKGTANSSKAAAKAIVNTINDGLDGVPVVGHLKGAIHYAAGDKNGGEKAMKAASRTVGVVAGGAGGFIVGGPAGAVAGGIAGGAAMDGVISGVDSAVHDKWRPYGQIAAWDAVAKGKTDQEIIDGVVGGLVTPAFDALGGYSAGKGVRPRASKPSKTPAVKPNLPRPAKVRQTLNEGNKRPSTAPSRGPAPLDARKIAISEKPNTSATGKTRGSTASTRASTAETSMKNVCTEQNLEGLGVDVEPIPRNPNNALNAFMEQQLAPQPQKPPSRGPAPLDARKIAISEKPNTSATGKTRGSTASTRASTAETSMKNVCTEQNLEGLGVDVEPIPRNPNNALNAFMEQQLAPQPQKPPLQSPAQMLPITLLAAGASNAQRSASQAKKSTSRKDAARGTRRGGERQRRGGGRGRRAQGNGEGGRGGGQDRGQGGPGTGRGGQRVRRGPLSMTYPDNFHANFGMSEDVFATFQDQGDGTFIATEGFDFVHAVLTTNDHPTTIATITGTDQTVQASSAGGLWETCTGSPISSSTCGVANCTNLHNGCSSNSPLHVGATAHVYLTSQSANHSIEYMVLMPTCSGNNNHQQCSNNNTNYPTPSQEANVLRARPGTRVMFIRIDRNTAGRKGGRGRGTGQGGTFGEHFSYGGGNGSSSAGP